MKGIVLISHGKLAEGMLDTLKMFSGDIKQIETVSLMPEDDLLNFTNLIENAVKKVDTGSGVIIFSDLLFGTPCNSTAKILANNNDVLVISGMNLPMILEFTNLRNSGETDVNKIINIGRDGIVDFSELYKNKKN